MKIRALSAVTLSGLCAVAGASAQTLTFSGLEHGRIVTNQFQASHGVTISANNPNRSFDLAVAFDSTRTGTADPDLEDAWNVGNLAPSTILGNMLIIQENNTGVSDGIANTPDDEGNRPGGELIFRYASPINHFGFDIVDVEGVGSEPGVVRFYLSNTLVGQVALGAFVDSNSAFYDASVVYGDNSANHLDPIFASEIGAASFDRVEIHLGGSGAVDNIVPEPASLAMLLIGFGAAAVRRR